MIGLLMVWRIMSDGLVGKLRRSMVPLEWTELGDEAANEIERLQAAIESIAKIFANDGGHPEYHEYRKAGLRKEWPALWAALNKLVDEYQR